jgi:hypothetical protein
MPRSTTAVFSLLACSVLLSACGSSFVASRGSHSRGGDAVAVPLGGLPSFANGIEMPQSPANAEPAAKFPLILAVATAKTGRDTYIRDIEEGVDITVLKKLPGVKDVVVLPSSTPGVNLYSTARSADADMLVIYQVSNARTHSGTTIPGLGVITLGAFPNEYEKAYASATATFIDTQTGYVYATVEATGSSTEIQNAWQDRDNTVELKAQRAALKELLKESRNAWKTIHTRFATND